VTPQLDDVAELWLRPERYVGVATATAANSWGGLDQAIASSWTLYGLSVLPRAGASRFEVTDAVRAAVAARELPRQPPPAPPAAADGPPRSSAAPRAAELPAPLQALRGRAALAPQAAAAPASSAEAEAHAAGAAGISDGTAAALVLAIRAVMGTCNDEAKVEDVLQRLRARGIELSARHLESLADWLHAEFYFFLKDDKIYKL